MSRLSIIFTVALIFVSFASSASNVTIRWTGQVPTSDCSTKPVSNTQELEQLKTKCPSEFQAIPNHLKNEKQKTVVSFNI